MKDEELLAQAVGLPTIYLDGLGAFRKINGVLRCVGYVIGSGAQLNLLISIAGAESGNREVRRILDEKSIRTSETLEQMRLAH